MNRPTSELQLSTTAREIFRAIQRAAAAGAALDQLLQLEELREQTPQIGPAADAGLRQLSERLCELASRGDGKAIAAELAALRGRVQAGTVLPKPYRPTVENPSPAFPAPRPEVRQKYPWLGKDSGLPR